MKFRWCSLFQKKTETALRACRLTVRRKLQWLLAGSLAVALLLAAMTLVWLIQRDHGRRAENETHAMLRDVGRRLEDIERQLLASATALAQREETIARLGLVTDYAMPENYQPLIYDDEKKRLARDLLLYAGNNLPTEASAYDGHAQIVALAYGAQRQQALHAINTYADGHARLLGGSGLVPDWQPVELPATIPGDAAIFGRPRLPLVQLRRADAALLIEAVAPVVRTRGNTTQTVGWVRVALPFENSGLRELAQLRGMQLELLFSGHFDADNPYRLVPLDFVGVPLLATMSEKHANIESPPSRTHHFFDAAMLALAQGEHAWLLAVLDRVQMEIDQGRAQKATLGVLVATLLIVVPLAGWLGRRWIATPLDRVREGVHAFAQGQNDIQILMPPGDEIGDLAEDFNLLAVAMRVREIAIKESEERWHAMIEAIDGSNIGLYIVDEDHRLRYASKSILRWFGTDLEGTLCHRALFASPTPCSFCPMDRVIHQGMTQHLQPAHTNGRHYDIIAMPVAGSAGKRTQLSLVQDITERLATERSMREAAMVFEATAEAIMVTDTQGVIKRVNPAFCLTTGYSVAEVVGSTPRILKSGRHDDQYFTTMWQQLTATGYWEGETWNRRKNGEVFPVWQVVTAVKDEHGELIEFISLFHDITQRKRSEAEIAYRANYDALTGLPNRTLLAERLSQSLKQARREGSHVGVMFIDLDLFKQVNDTLGHAFGDLLLQAVAERMRQCVRETDTIARQGGDEFVVLLVDVESSVAAGGVAEKIIAQLAAPFDLGGHEVHIGASIGITLFPEDGNDIETLFRNADLAMYRAKDAGRNNAQFFEQAMTTAAIERRTLEADLRGATARQEFVLHYQPVVDLASGAIVGAEALLRWNHPQRGHIGPDQFVPVAEESGLIREIGTWVFEEACTQLAAWQAAGHTLSLAINVSVRQLPETLSVSHMLGVVARHGLAPRQIVLEITEGVLLADAPAVQAWFNDAGTAGMKLAIDDFGTGYSSLAYLKRFPVHHVKIDKAFVRDMATDPADRALVEAILAMAHSLGLSVVAEGVETGEQAELLRARRCELAQGYLYGRPVAAAEFTALLG